MTKRKDKGKSDHGRNHLAAAAVLFFPILFGTFFQQLYNAADAMIVGGLWEKRHFQRWRFHPKMLTQLIVGFFVALIRRVRDRVPVLRGKTAGDGGLCGPHGTDVQYHFRRRDHVCWYRVG